MTSSFNKHLYGDEIAPILDMVCSHRPLDEIESVACPHCGATLSVWFTTDGKGFGVHCTAEDTHHSRFQDLSVPPDWWRERIGDFGPVTYYYPTMFETGADGTITMRATGWNDDGHWTGVHRVRPDTPDFAFWLWVVGQRTRWPRFFSDRELESLKSEFANVA